MGAAPAKTKFINLSTKSTKKRDEEGHIKDEFGDLQTHWKCSNMRGTLAMANSGLANSGGSQFFVNVIDQPELDWFSPTNRKKSEKKGQNKGHPVFANVISGLDVIDKISALRHEDPMVEKGQKPIQIMSMELIGVDLPKVK